MKKINILFLVIFLVSTALIANDKVTVSGRVTDFTGNPIDSALVRIMDRNFNVSYYTYSSPDGSFTLEAQKGDYNCIYATKVSEYRKTKLEYWAWHVPLYQNMEINPKFNNMEIYGINIVEPQVTPYETYMIYFRPMSLKKILQLVDKQKIDKQAYTKIKKVEDLLTPNTENTFNVAPDSITPNELSVKINGIESKVVNIQRVREFARGMNMYGYYIQVVKPTETPKSEINFDKVSITLTSKETGEIGLGEAFVKRNQETIHFIY